MNHLNHLNIENPCNMCEHYIPEYILGHIPTYDRCSKIKSIYRNGNVYCDIERDPRFDIISQCSSTGRCFKPSSKKKLIMKHIRGFFFGVNSIIILILTIPFLITLF